MIWLLPTMVTLLGASLLATSGKIENGMAELVVFVVGISLIVCGIIMFGLLLWLAA